MPVFCDTSVLVASMVEEHPHHTPSLAFIHKLQRQKMRSLISLHSVAECYSALTSMSLKEPIVPRQAVGMIEDNILKVFDLVRLDLRDYRRVLERIEGLNLNGAIIHDAVIFQAAIKKKADNLVTWNRKHFEQLSRGEIQIITPEALLSS